MDKNEALRQEYIKQVELLCERADEVSEAFYKALKPIMTDKVLTPNNKISSALLAVIGVIDTITEVMNKVGAGPNITFDDMLKNLKTVREKFERIMEGEREGRKEDESKRNGKA